MDYKTKLAQKYAMNANETCGRFELAKDAFLAGFNAGRKDHVPVSSELIANIEAEATSPDGLSYSHEFERGAIWMLKEMQEEMTLLEESLTALESALRSRT